MNDAEAIRRMRSGHAAAALKQRELDRVEGARPEQAIAEALAAAALLAADGRWPCPPDATREAAVARVRARWVRIERHAGATL
ncbi:MAG: hypothetical protein FJ096_09375 [Deltaproteobacteria bacterium]|nr:hypothetical protein [Deltaproteobacteria bacterium]